MPRLPHPSPRFLALFPQRILVSRKADAPPGSYTKRLFDDGELLKDKLLEEAQELAEATEPDHVAAEAADLIYFALVSAGVFWGCEMKDTAVASKDAGIITLVMVSSTRVPSRLQVACARVGVGLSDIESHLDRRALKVRRRPGDSKPVRIAAAKAHFEALQAAAASKGVAAASTASGAGSSTGDAVPVATA